MLPNFKSLLFTIIGLCDNIVILPWHASYYVSSSSWLRKYGGSTLMWGHIEKAEIWYTIINENFVSEYVPMIHSCQNTDDPTIRKNSNNQHKIYWQLHELVRVFGFLILALLTDLSLERHPAHDRKL